MGASATLLLVAAMAVPASAQNGRYSTVQSYEVSPLPAANEVDQPYSGRSPYGERGAYERAPYSEPYGSGAGQYSSQRPEPYYSRETASQPVPPASSPYQGAASRPYGEGSYTGSVQGAPEQTYRPPAGVGGRTTIAALPAEDQPEEGPAKELPERFKRQIVDYPTKEPAGTLIVDTANTYLYLVMPHGKAMRYGIGVGREGFTWSGTERISRMAEWPDWHPPAEMIERQPYLPRFMAGGESNPLGARALYLGKTVYRIHGTNQPSTIGQTVSSGCIRLVNSDIEDLYQRVQVGTRVVVLPGKPSSQQASAQSQPSSAAPQAGAPQPIGPQSMSPQPLPPAGVPQQARAGYPAR
jgi:lipoprotein-anchoring transpeptidase ErfK/SrfK